MDNLTRISFTQKITFLSFALCCGVVSQHTKWTCKDFEFLNNIQHFWFYIVQTCVPFFFMISGYLFYRTYRADSWKPKLSSRAKSLLIPYLFWNVIYAVFMFALDSVNLLSNHLSISLLTPGGVISCLNSEYSHLWFVKYLMIFVVISPFMYFILNKRLLGGLAILILLIINCYNYYSGLTHIPLNVNSNDWVMIIYQYIFFATGGYAALCYRNHIEVFSKKRSIYAIVVITALVLIYWIFLRSHGDVITNHTFRLVWCIAVFFACDLLHPIKEKKWMKYSFFIYCSHLMFVMCLQGITTLLYNHIEGYRNFLMICEYIGLPIATIVILILIGNTVKSLAPKCWNLVTGGRA